MAQPRRPGSSQRSLPAAIVAVSVIGLVAVIVWTATSGRPPPQATSPLTGAQQTQGGTDPASGAIASGTSAASPGPIQTEPATAPSTALASPLFPGGLLIADRDNGRLIVVDDAGQILWRFPVAGSLPAGQTFSGDDAFIAPDGKTIVSNEESHQVVVRIDIATEKVVWEYGSYDSRGSTPGQLWTPDDAYPLANGDVTIADIKNCRVIEVSPDKQIVKQWGQTGLCRHTPPDSYGSPNGDTPLADGGMLVTEIDGSRVVRLSPTGAVLFDIHVPARYPSDAQLLPDGNVLVVDFSNPGVVLVIDPATDHVVYRYDQATGDGRLNHPSLAAVLPDGSFVINDDDRARVVVIDPKTNAITWSYGQLDQPGNAGGQLNLPDGVDVLPAGVFPVR